MLYVFKKLENRERARENRNVYLTLKLGKQKNNDLQFCMCGVTGVDRLYLHYERPQEQKKLILFEHFTGKH